VQQRTNLNSTSWRPVTNIGAQSGVRTIRGEYAEHAIRSRGLLSYRHAACAVAADVRRIRPHACGALRPRRGGARRSDGAWSVDTFRAASECRAP